MRRFNAGILGWALTGADGDSDGVHQLGSAKLASGGTQGTRAGTSPRITGANGVSSIAKQGCQGSPRKCRKDRVGLLATQGLIEALSYTVS